MIGVLQTVHPDHGYAISIRYIRIDGNVKILGIHTHGKDVLSEFTDEQLRYFQQQIKNL